MVNSYYTDNVILLKLSKVITYYTAMNDETTKAKMKDKKLGLELITHHFI